MARCAGLKRDGGQCTATVEPPQRYCWWHDPANAEKRRRSASKAARSKPSRELREIKALLETLTNRVLGEDGEKALGTGPAAVANQLINTRLRAVELGRKVKETEELEERLDALERAQHQEGGSKRWGA
jgi:hypothetical protein